MCGIFGVICASHDPAARTFARSLIVSLLKSSETRGREAAGIAVHDGRSIEVLKQAGSVTEFMKNRRLHELVNGDATDSPLLAITGHSRLACNGTQADAANNQPVITHGAVTLHNGIIVNDRAIAERHHIAPRSELDSEVLATLLRTKLDATGDLVSAARETFAELQGSASIAMMFDNLQVMLLATNTGSLFQLTSEDNKLVAFASERFILQRVLDEKQHATRFGGCRLRSGSFRLSH